MYNFTFVNIQFCFAWRIRAYLNNLKFLVEPLLFFVAYTVRIGLYKIMFMHSFTPFLLNMKK